MSPQSQQIAIAEACGIVSKDQWGPLYKTPRGILRDCPDYLEDLNAMHDVERGDEGGREMNYLNLTPKQFCDATNACVKGYAFAITQQTMADVWGNCQHVDWLLWILDKLNRRPDGRTLRLFAIWCVRTTPLLDGRKVGDLLIDPRSLAALEVAERYANGNATPAELAAARAAAWAAAGDAAGAAAGAAARDAAWAAARAAAWDAAWAAAGDAAWDAARDAAVDAAVDAQADQLRKMIPNPFAIKEGA